MNVYNKIRKCLSSIDNETDQCFDKLEEYYNYRPYDIIINDSNLAPSSFGIKDNDNNELKWYAIFYFLLQECISKKAKEYTPSITPDTKLSLYKKYLAKPNMINTNSLINNQIKYPKRFSSSEREVLAKSGCSPKKVEKYNPRFDGEDIALFISEGYNSKKINGYNKRFDSSDIIRFIKVGCSPKEADEYGIRFNSYEVCSFFLAKYSPKEISKYSKRFDGEDTINLLQEGYTSEEADKYDKRFNGKEIAFLIKHGYPHKEANEYSKRFSGQSVIQLIKKGYSPKKAEKYDLRFNDEEILCLIKVKCPPQDANKYPKRFSGETIAELFKSGCTPKKAEEYNLRFNVDSVLDLFKVGCSPKMADKYSRNIDGYGIALLFAMGTEPKDAPTSLNVKIMNLLAKATCFSRITEKAKKLKRAKEFNQLGTGVSGIVVLKKGDAWKFSKQVSHEYDILKKIQNYHKSKQKNITKVKGEPQNFFNVFDEFITIPNPVIKMEHIEGDSLENILSKYQSLSRNKTSRYALDIINGLIEMRKAGVWYHRDIRPANIMIDEKKDRAVIIDFGIATTNKRLKSKDNRRYGGINDLVSLGQIIYKMATGEHLFAESKSMDSTTYAQKIKDYRDKVYSDKTGKLLKKHFQQIDRKIKDEKLKDLIKVCLTAKNSKYQKIQSMIRQISS